MTIIYGSLYASYRFTWRLFLLGYTQHSPHNTQHTNRLGTLKEVNQIRDYDYIGGAVFSTKAAREIRLFSPSGHHTTTRIDDPSIRGFARLTITALNTTARTRTQLYSFQTLVSFRIRPTTLYKNGVNHVHQSIF